MGCAQNLLPSERLANPEQSAATDTEGFFAPLRRCDFIQISRFFPCKLIVFSVTFCEKSIKSQPLRITAAVSAWFDPAAGDCVNLACLRSKPAPLTTKGAAPYSAEKLKKSQPLGITAAVSAWFDPTAGDCANLACLRSKPAPLTTKGAAPYSAEKLKKSQPLGMTGKGAKDGGPWHIDPQASTPRQETAGPSAALGMTAKAGARTDNNY